MHWWRIQAAWNELGLESQRIHQRRDFHRSCLGIWWENWSFLDLDLNTSALKSTSCPASFLDCPSRSFLRPVDPSQCFILDEGICLYCQCTHSVISANRPEEPSPAGAREEAEDFRATDSGILAMRFDASIHWPETLDLNGAAWLCPCLA